MPAIFIERESHPDTTPCECANCEWVGTIFDVEECDDVALTPGDQCPAGCCPLCDCLAYVITDKTKAADAAPAMLAALRDAWDMLPALKPRHPDYFRYERIRQAITAATL